MCCMCLSHYDMDIGCLHCTAVVCEILAVISWPNFDLFIHRCASSGRYVRAYPAGGCSKRTEESSRTTCKSKQSIM